MPSSLREFNSFYRTICFMSCSSYAWLGIQWLYKPKLTFWVCPSRRWLRIACPGCGLTHSMFAAAKGNVILAFWYNPLGPALLVVLLVLPIFLWVDYRHQKQYMKRLHYFLVEAEHQSRKKYTILLLLIMSWLWALVKEHLWIISTEAQ